MTEIKMEPVSEEERERLTRAYPAFAEHFGFVRGRPGNVLLTGRFQQLAPSFLRLKLRQDDIFVVTLPKSGTQWTMEMVWLIANDCDFDGAKTLLRQRVPMLEERTQFSRKHCWVDGTDSTSNPIDSMTSPRFAKSHLPFHFLPADLLDTCKVVYVARNPKDVAVSSYFHHKLTKDFDTTLSMSEYFEFFMKGDVFYTPIWSHLLPAWEKRFHPNLLFLFYEDMKSDLPGQMMKVAAFLGKQLTGEQVSLLDQHLSFDQLKNNPAVNKHELNEQGHYKKDMSFMRNGRVGDWKNYFDAEMNARFDRWIEENTAGTDLKFRYSDS